MNSIKRNAMMSLLICLGATAFVPVARGEEAAQILAAANPGVVLILAGDEANSGGSSAGFVVSPEGKILTLAQTVLNPNTGQPFRHIFVYLKPPALAPKAASNLMNRYSAQVIASSAPNALDLALLQMEDAPAAMVPLIFGNANQLAAGSEALAVGHAESAGLWTGQRLHVVSRVDNYARVAGRQCWVLDRGVGFGQWGGPLLDEAGHVQGMVVAPSSGRERRQAGPKTQTAAAFSPGAALTSTVLVGWLAQNNMALAVPGSPPGDDPDSISDNPTPQPSTVAVVDAAPDAEAARRRATSAAHGSSEPVTVAGPKAAATPPKAVQAAGLDSFIEARRPYSLHQTHRQQLRASSGTNVSTDGAPQTPAAKSADKER